MPLSIDPANIKGLAFDLDGTILNTGAVLAERTRLAIRACAAMGIQIIIATGRSIESVEPYRAALGVSGPMVYFNGAVVAENSGLAAKPGLAKIHKTFLLSAEAAEFCIDISRSMGIYLQIYFPPGPGESEWMLMSETDGLQRDNYTRHTGIESRLGDLKAALKDRQGQGCVKGMFLAEPAILSRLRPRLEEHFGQSVYLARTSTSFLEILNIDASKGNGLAFALEKRGIKKEQAIAFGDEENDLPMFKAAAYFVAPGNAIDAVKAAANHISLPNTEDGIAVFLEEFFHIGK
ncbi:MAG: Cof-type HAD-IIB family hydrolase [Treponema sp.]|jgi:Cof subfamily protein (haloacid dehalogenase superfamily)|nr:Cof-type HAD-IIB family hydrolase [Treponema sp.]